MRFGLAHAHRVALISTYHGTGVSDGKPIVVRDYNVCMGGVDKKDQMLSAYPIERKQVAFDKKTTLFFLVFLFLKKCIN